MDLYVWVITIAIALVVWTVPYVSGNVTWIGWRRWAWLVAEIAWFYVVIAALRGDL